MRGTIGYVGRQKLTHKESVFADKRRAKEKAFYANEVIEYMTGEWNKVTPKVEQQIRTILEETYFVHPTPGQFEFMEKAFGMKDGHNPDAVDETDLVNAMTEARQKAKLEFWDK